MHEQFARNLHIASEYNNYCNRISYALITTPSRNSPSWYLTWDFPVQLSNFPIQMKLNQYESLLE